MEGLPGEWKELIIVPIYKKATKLSVVIIGECHWYQLHTRFYPMFSSQG
jgi:hypothetical protein